MSRRTVLLAAVVALAGCHGTNSSMNSSFKMPTPSFNILAPYGPPRVPPPSTHSYGQPAALGPTASNTQPYYPASNGVRGVSLPQSPESGDTQATPAPPAGKVATAVWRSARGPAKEDDAATSATLASHQATTEAAAASPSGEAPILIPEYVVQPAESAPLLLGGMRAHDLTKAVSDASPQVAMAAAPAPTMMVASALPPAPVATQVIYAAPVAVPVATPAAASSELIEMTDLPQGASSTNRGLQRVRGFDEPPVAAASSEAAPDNFIAPERTISASAAKETRDAVAAATLESEPAIIKPASTPASGWKSRFSTDES